MATDQTIKADAGKPRLALVPPALIEAVGRVRPYGLAKYGTAESWCTVASERYKDAFMRHLCAYLRNPAAIDPESGLKHLEHMACNIAFLLELEYGLCEDDFIIDLALSMCANHQPAKAVPVSWWQRLKDILFAPGGDW